MDLNKVLNKVAEDELAEIGMEPAIDDNVESVLAEVENDPEFLDSLVDLVLSEADVDRPVTEEDILAVLAQLIAENISSEVDVGGTPDDSAVDVDTYDEDEDMA